MRQWVVALVTLAVAGVCGWALYVAADPRRMPVSAVQVEGDLRYLSSEVLAQTVAGPASVGFFRVDLPQVRARVTELPWIRDAQVRRVWPDRLLVSVRERVPAARWAAGGLVDNEGALFQPPASEYPDGLVELEGPEGTQALALRRYRELREWLTATGWGVRRVVLDTRRAWRVDTDRGVTLVLGREPVEAAVRRVSRVLPALQAQSGGALAVVDLRYPNGFAVRWRPPPEAPAAADVVPETRPEPKTGPKPAAKPEGKQRHGKKN
jgi:cell division protein FtsQ